MVKFKRINKRVFLLSMIICVIFIATLFLYHNILVTNLHNENIRSIKVVSDQNKVSVNKKIKDIFNVIDETKYHIVKHSYENNQLNKYETVEECESIVERQQFKKMGVALKDGKCYTSENKIEDISHLDFYKTAMKGQDYISDPIYDEDIKESSVILSSPIYDQKEIIGVICVTYLVDDFRDEIAVNSFNNEGYSYVIKSNGDAVVNSSQETTFENSGNLFISLNEISTHNKECSEQLKKGLSSSKEGYIIFNNNVDKYCYYNSLGINDWFLLTIVPKSVIDSTTSLVMEMTTLFFIFLSILFFCLVFYVYKTLKNKNNELTKILYEDKVTHEMSYEKFIQTVPVLLNQLKTSEKVAILFLDIDKFKLINDLFGYNQGNQTIKFISDAIKKNISDGEIFARVSADQFIILLIYNTKDQLEKRVKDIRKSISSKIVQTHRENYSLKSIVGIYEVKDLNENIQFMQNCATIAHTQAKKRRDVDYLFYDDDMRNHLLSNKKLEDKMKEAIANHEFVVYYQPKYDAKSKKPNGAEALIRWIEKDGTFHAPKEFIHLAEINGLIKSLDEIVFSNVCKDIREILDKNKIVLPVSVNVSRKTLYDSHFIDTYQSYMKKYKIPVNLIQLEITENLLIEDKIKMRRTIEQLQGIGFKILMDDFGTGYSSLQMLKDIPIDILKLDKSFVDDYSDGKGSKILEATVSLAQAMEIDTVAEGVETETQYEYLRDLDCDSIQGYYFSRPVDRNTYIKLLEKCVTN